MKTISNKSLQKTLFTLGMLPAILAGLSTSSFAAETAVFQQGESPTSEYKMQAAGVRSFPDRANYNDHELLVGFIDSLNHRIEARTVLSFDLSALPKGAKIQAIELVLVPHSADGASAPQAMDLAIYPLNVDFEESTVSWVLLDEELGASFQSQYEDQPEKKLSGVMGIEPKAVVGGASIVFPSSPLFVKWSQEAFDKSKPLDLTVLAQDPDPGNLSLRTLVRFASNLNDSVSIRPMLRVTY